jgi:hypothetical protein
MYYYKRDIAVKFEEFCRQQKMMTLMDNVGAREVFEFLTYPQTISDMLTVQKLGITPLNAVVRDLEEKFLNLEKFPMTDPKTRQAVGKMVRFIMNRFGLSPTKKSAEPIRKAAGAAFFKSGSSYEKTHPASYEIAVRLVQMLDEGSLMDVSTGNQELRQILNGQ